MCCTCWNLRFHSYPTRKSVGHWTFADLSAQNLCKINRLHKQLVNPNGLRFFVSDQMAFKTTYTQDVGNFASDQVGHYPKGLKFFVSDQTAFKTTYTQDVGNFASG